MRPLVCILGALIAPIAIASIASAACVCRCVDGRMQALCGSALDVEPVCPPAICPPPLLSVQPIPHLVVPPVGTSACREAQIFDERSGRYVWRTVCR
jgi:hypothetical protein